MLTIFVTFTWLKILSTVASGFLAYGIARKDMTPTRTYMLFALSFLWFMGNIIYNYNNALSADAFLRSPNQLQTLIAQMNSFGPFLLQFLAFLFKFSAISITANKK